MTKPKKSPLKPERELVFDANFLIDLKYWVETDRKIALRLLTLVEEIRRNPFEGIGKPEPLKYRDANVWSRRLTQVDRVVYVVSHDRIEFLQPTFRRLVSKVNNIFGKRNRGKTEYGDVQGLS